MQGALGSIPGRYSCLENSMDSGAWRATVYGIAKSDTTEHSCIELDPTCRNSTDWTKSGTWHTDPLEFFWKSQALISTCLKPSAWGQPRETSGVGPAVLFPNWKGVSAWTLGSSKGRRQDHEIWRQLELGSQEKSHYSGATLQPRNVSPLIVTISIKYTTAYKDLLWKKSRRPFLYWLQGLCWDDNTLNVLD